MNASESNFLNYLVKASIAPPELSKLVVNFSYWKTLQKNDFFCGVFFHFSGLFPAAGRRSFWYHGQTIRNGGVLYMNQPHFTYEAEGQTLIVHLPEELDHHNCLGLKYETDLILSENYIRRIVFDFSMTRFMDSSGIGILLNRYKQMALSGGAVGLYGAGPRALRILKIGGILKLMKLYDSKEAAVRS
jgi:stage II sporulation protein AA (anti-sigma F factor antagonist)